jgi:hypothetical protein
MSVGWRKLQSTEVFNPGVFRLYCALRLEGNRMWLSGAWRVGQLTGQHNCMYLPHS